jgi:hypothetical protein
LLAPILAGACDVVYGTRRAARRLSPREPRHWRFIAASWTLTRIVNLLFGARLTDYATGYKAFTNAVAQQLTLRSEGFEICAEMTAQFLKLGHPIVEAPIRYRPRTIAQGKKIRAPDGWRALRTMVRERVT